MAQKFLRSWLLVLLLILLALPAKADVPIDSAHFPDAAFREAVRAAGDTGYMGPLGKWIGANDGFLHAAEIARLTGLTVHSISSAKGIEYLIALDTFGSRNGNLTSINLSNNPRIGLLNLDYNKFTSINVSSLSGLYHFHCIGNKLTSLNVSSNAALQELMCSNNPLGKLNVSNNSALSFLVCDFNELEKLDVSHNPALTKLHCIGNELTALDLTQNPALTALYCDNNHITELDLSRNQALTEVHCYGQTAKGLIVKATDKGYEVNIKDYVKNLENLDVYSFQANHSNAPFVSYEDGVVTFSELPENVTYFYRTHSPNNALMDVTIERSLIIEAIGGGPNHGQEIICDIDANSYKNSSGEKIDEAYISQLKYSDYGKFGFTADGNSRIILRVRTDAPGSVTFSMPGNNLGIGIEALTNRADLNSGGSVAAYEIEDGVYQASAVLVAPEAFPSGKNFPSDSFAVLVTFYGSDGSVKSGMIELKIEAAPVVLIPGIDDSAAKTFGTDASGARSVLVSQGFEVYPWNYNGYFSVKYILREDYNAMFNILSAAIGRPISRGIVCTKADIVAFGFGGLLTRKFLSEDGKDKSDGNNWTMRSYKQGMVRRVITIATPHNGTPWANFKLRDYSVLTKLGLSIFELFGQNLISILNYAEYINTPSLRDMKLGSDIVASAYPINVPMHAIYGDDSRFLNYIIMAVDVISYAFGSVKDFKKIAGSLDNLFKAFTKGIKGEFKNWDAFKAYLRQLQDRQNLYNFTRNSVISLPFKEQIIKIAFNIISIMTNPGSTLIAEAIKLWPVFLNTSLFHDELHDSRVPADSAMGAMDSHSTGFGVSDVNFLKIFMNNLKYSHSKICRQLDVGSRVAELLKGQISNFKVFGRLSATNNNIKAARVVTPRIADDEYDYPVNVQHFVLTAESKVLSVADRGKIKLTAVSDVPISDDVCVLIQNDDLYTLMIIADKIDDYNFECTAEFSSEDIGLMEAICFSFGNERNLYISNTARFAVKSEQEFENVSDLEFTGSFGTIYTNVSSDVAADLYLKSESGNEYDISSPLMGAEWIVEDPSIAYIDENGRVVGLKEGSTNLTAVYNGVSASVRVEVGEAYAPEAYQDEDNNKEDSEDSNEKDDEDGKGGNDAKPKTNSGGGGGCSSTNLDIFALLSLSAFALNARKRF